MSMLTCLNTIGIWKIGSWLEMFCRKVKKFLFVIGWYCRKIISDCYKYILSHSNKLCYFFRTVGDGVWAIILWLNSTLCPLPPPTLPVLNLLLYNLTGIVCDKISACTPSTTTRRIKLSRRGWRFTIAVQCPICTILISYVLESNRWST